LESVGWQEKWTRWRRRRTYGEATERAEKLTADDEYKAQMLEINQIQGAEAVLCCQRQHRRGLAQNCGPGRAEGVYAAGGQGGSGWVHG